MIKKNGKQSQTWSEVWNREKLSSKIQAGNPPKTSAKEEEAKIAAMGLGELKDLACPKALQFKKDWCMVCVRCPESSVSCKIGKRVNAILEEESKKEEHPTQIDKFNERMHAKTIISGINTKYGLVGREAYIETLKQPDPVAYIMEKNGSSREAAKGRLRKWADKYPDVKIPEKEIVEVEPVKESKNNSEVKQPVKEHKKNLSPEKAREKARKTVEEAFTYKDGVWAYFRDILGVTDHRIVRGRVYNWARIYSDLCEKYQIDKWVVESRLRPYDKKEKAEEPEMAAKKNAEELSVEDFLEEMDQKEEPVKEIKVVDRKTNQQSTVVVSEKPVEESHIHAEKPVEESHIHAEKPVEDDLHIACRVFSEKRKSLAKKRDELQKAIEDAQKIIEHSRKEIAEVSNDLSKLDEAAKIMGFRVRISAPSTQIMGFQGEIIEGDMI